MFNPWVQPKFGSELESCIHKLNEYFQNIQESYHDYLKKNLEENEKKLIKEINIDKRRRLLIEKENIGISIKSLTNIKTSYKDEIDKIKALIMLPNIDFSSPKLKQLDQSQKFKVINESNDDSIFSELEKCTQKEINQRNNASINEITNNQDKYNECIQNIFQNALDDINTAFSQIQNFVVYQFFQVAERNALVLLKFPNIQRSQIFLACGMKLESLALAKINYEDGKNLKNENIIIASHTKSLGDILKQNDKILNSSKLILNSVNDMIEEASNEYNKLFQEYKAESKFILEYVDQLKGFMINAENMNINKSDLLRINNIGNFEKKKHINFTESVMGEIIRNNQNRTKIIESYTKYNEILVQVFKDKIQEIDLNIESIKLNSSKIFTILQNNKSEDDLKLKIKQVFTEILDTKSHISKKLPPINDFTKRKTLKESLRSNNAKIDLKSKSSSKRPTAVSPLQKEENKESKDKLSNKNYESMLKTRKKRTPSPTIKIEDNRDIKIKYLQQELEGYKRDKDIMCSIMNQTINSFKSLGMNLIFSGSKLLSYFTRQTPSTIIANNSFQNDCRAMENFLSNLSKSLWVSSLDKQKTPSPKPNRSKANTNSTYLLTENTNEIVRGTNSSFMNDFSKSWSMSKIDGSPSIEKSRKKSEEPYKCKPLKNAINKKILINTIDSPNTTNYQDHFIFNNLKSSIKAGKFPNNNLFKNDSELKSELEDLKIDFNNLKVKNDRLIEDITLSQSKINMVQKEKEELNSNFQNEISNSQNIVKINKLLKLENSELNKKFDTFNKKNQHLYIKEEEEEANKNLKQLFDNVIDKEEKISNLKNQLSEKSEALNLDKFIKFDNIQKIIEELFCQHFKTVLEALNRNRNRLNEIDIKLKNKASIFAAKNSRFILDYENYKHKEVRNIEKNNYEKKKNLINKINEFDRNGQQFEELACTIENTQSQQLLVFMKTKILQNNIQIEKLKNECNQFKEEKDNLAKNLRKLEDSLILDYTKNTDSNQQISFTTNVEIIQKKTFRYNKDDRQPKSMLDFIYHEVQKLMQNTLELHCKNSVLNNSNNKELEKVNIEDDECLKKSKKDLKDKIDELINLLKRKDQLELVEEKYHEDNECENFISSLGRNQILFLMNFILELIVYAKITKDSIVSINEKKNQMIVDINKIEERCNELEEVYKQSSKQCDEKSLQIQKFGELLSLKNDELNQFQKDLNLIKDDYNKMMDEKEFMCQNYNRVQNELIAKQESCNIHIEKLTNIMKNDEMMHKELEKYKNIHVQYEEKINSLLDENHKLDQKYRDLFEELKENQKLVTKKNQEIQDILSKNDNDKDMLVVILNDKIINLEKEINTLQTKIEINDKDKDKERMLNEYKIHEDKFNELKIQYETLQNKFKNINNHIEGQSNKISISKAQNLNKKIEIIPGEETKKADAIILEDEELRVQNSLEQSNELLAQLDQMNNIIYGLQGIVEKKEELPDIQDKINHYENQLSEFSSQLERLNNDLKKEKQLNEEVLQKYNEESKKFKEQEYHFIQGIQKLEMDNKELVLEKEKLYFENSNYEKIKKNLEINQENLIKELSIINLEFEKLKKRKQDYELIQNKETNSFLQKITNLENTINEKSKIIVNLKKKLLFVAIIMNLNQNKLNNVMDQNNELNKIISQNNQILQKIKDDYETLACNKEKLEFDKENKIVELMNELDAKQIIITELISESDKNNKELLHKKTLLNEKELDNQKTLSKFSELENILSQFSIKEKDFLTTIEKLNNNIQDLNAELLIKEENFKILKENFILKEKECSELSILNKNLKDELEKAKFDITAHNIEVKNQNEYIQQLQHQIKGIESKLKIEELKIINSQNELSKKLQKIEALLKIIIDKYQCCMNTKNNTILALKHNQEIIVKQNTELNIFKEKEYEQLKQKYQKIIEEYENIKNINKIENSIINEELLEYVNKLENIIRNINNLDFSQEQNINRKDEINITIYKEPQLMVNDFNNESQSCKKVQNSLALELDKNKELIQNDGEKIKTLNETICEIGDIFTGQNSSPKFIEHKKNLDYRFFDANENQSNEIIKKLNDQLKNLDTQLLMLNKYYLNQLIILQKKYEEKLAQEKKNIQEENEKLKSNYEARLKEEAGLLEITKIDYEKKIEAEKSINLVKLKALEINHKDELEQHKLSFEKEILIMNETATTELNRTKDLYSKEMNLLKEIKEEEQKNMKKIIQNIIKHLETRFIEQIEILNNVYIKFDKEIERIRIICESNIYNIQERIKKLCDENEELKYIILNERDQYLQFENLLANQIEYMIDKLKKANVYDPNLYDTDNKIEDLFLNLDNHFDEYNNKIMNINQFMQDLISLINYDNKEIDIDDKNSLNKFMKAIMSTFNKQIIAYKEIKDMLDK